MPAGDYPAGQGPAGFDPVWVPTPPTPAFLPRAEFYDPFQKRFFLTQEDRLGLPAATPPTYIDMHPIDQIVALRGTTQKGQSKSATDLGTRIAAVCARQPSARVPQLAYQEVANVFADLIANGDILLLSVTADTSVRGRNLFTINYVNLRDPSTNPKFPLANAQTVDVLGQATP
jgi:hypothetical protein